MQHPGGGRRRAACADTDGLSCVGDPTNHHTEKLGREVFFFFFFLVHHLKGLFYFTKIVADTPEFANTYLLYLSYREPEEQRGWGKTQDPTQRSSVGDVFAKGGTAAQPRWPPPVSASYLPANCLERAVGRGVMAQAVSRGRAGAALPLGLKGRCWEPVGTSQHSSYASVFPPRERMLRTTLQHVQGWRARNRTSLYILVTRVVPVGKSPSANSKKYLLFSPPRSWWLPHALW